MVAPVASETSQYSRTTFLEPAICLPRQGTIPPHSNPRPTWRNEDSQQHVEIPPVDSTLSGRDSFDGRGYSSSFLRSSAGHHSNQQCLPPPLTEPPSPRPYFGVSLMPSYPEPPQYHLGPRDPHISSDSPTFPLRPLDDWSLARTSSLPGPQELVWGRSHGALTGPPGLSHKRSYSTISSDAASTPARETDSQVSLISPESPWDQPYIEVPSPHGGQRNHSPAPRAPTAPWFGEDHGGASRTRQPIYSARKRVAQACQPCRLRKVRVCSIRD